VTTVKIDIDMIGAAITAAEDLATAIDTQSAAARSASPISLPSLATGTLGKKSQWIRDHLEDLTTRRDLAILLDQEGTGSASYTVASDTAANVKKMLGEALADNQHLANPYFPEEFGKFNDMLALYADDADVMVSFYDSLGAEGALKLLSNAGVDAEGYGLDPSVQAQLLERLKQGLETATHDPAFDGRTFAEEMIEQATVDPEEIMGRGTYNPSGALAYLLWDGDYGREFLSTMVTGLDEYERITMDGAGNDIWGRRPDGGADFSRFMPPEAGGDYANLDVMASAMSALANDSAYALEFFGSETAEDGSSPLMEYYLKDRDWDQDAMGGITAALDAAATDPAHIADPHSPEAQDAARLASQTVHYISERDDLEAITKRIAWPGFTTSENLAHLMGTYMAGVDRGLDPGLAGDETGPGVIEDRFGAPNTPLFDYDSLTKLGLMTVASDEGAAVMRGMLDEHRAGTITAAAQAVARGDEGADAILEEVLRRDARREGMFEALVGDEAINEGRAADERTKAWVSLAGEALGVVPVPGVGQISEGIARDLANAAVSQARSGGESWIVDQLTGAEKSAYEEANVSADDRQQAGNYAIARLLLNAGLGDPEYDPPSWQEYLDSGDAGRAQVWEDVFSTDNAMPQFNTGEWDTEYTKMRDRDYFSD